MPQTSTAQPNMVIKIPTESWRWIVANWPPCQWIAWHRRVNELMPSGAKAAMIATVQQRAYQELA